MKNKQKIINILVIFFMILLLFSSNKMANTTGTVFLESNKDVIGVGETIEITLNLENASTAAFTSHIIFDTNKFEYLSGPDNSNIKDNQIIFVWYDEDGGNSPKNGKLATFKFKSKENGIANFLVSGEFYTKEGQLIDTEFNNIQINIGENDVAKKENTVLSKIAEEEQGESIDKNNTKLKSLRLDIEGLVPSFEKNINEYYLTVSSDIKNIEVLAIAENPDAKVEVTGNNNLKLGENTINIKINSENNNNSEEYKIYVTRTKDLEEANTNLETLAIENAILTPPFDNNVTKYTTEVSNELEDVNILAIPENEKANVKIMGKDDLKEGNNIITISVIAENGTTKKEYEINVYKRNETEEKEYLEDEENNEEELEEAYDIEYTLNEEEIDGLKNEDSNRNIRIIIFSVSALFVISIVCIYVFIKYKENQKNNNKNKK